MQGNTSLQIAAGHGFFMGAMYALLSAIYISAIWMPGVSILMSVVLFFMVILMAGMHNARRNNGARYTTYTLLLFLFATLLSSLFTYLVIMAAGFEVTTARIANEILTSRPDLASNREMMQLLFDPRMHVTSLAVQYWLVGVLILSPLGNLLAILTKKMKSFVLQSENKI